MTRNIKRIILMITVLAVIVCVPGLSEAKSRDHQQRKHRDRHHWNKGPKINFDQIRHIQRHGPFIPHNVIKRFNHGASSGKIPYYYDHQKNGFFFGYSAHSSKPQRNNYLRNRFLIKLAGFGPPFSLE